MWPRLGGRGEPYAADATPDKATVLQCGHGWAAVENPWTIGRIEAAQKDFNVATAGRPWRTVRPLPQRLSLPLLQCGHGWAAVENRTTRRCTTTASSLQCGHGWAAVE